KPPIGTSDVVLKMLGITPRAEKARVIANKAFSEFIRKFVGDDLLEGAETDDDLRRFQVAVQAIINERETLRLQLRDMTVSRDEAKAKVQELQTKVDAYD